MEYSLSQLEKSTEVVDWYSRLEKVLEKIGGPKKEHTNNKKSDNDGAENHSERKCYIYDVNNSKHTLQFF